MYGLVAKKSPIEIQIMLLVNSIDKSGLIIISIITELLLVNSIDKSTYVPPYVLM